MFKVKKEKRLYPTKKEKKHMQDVINTFIFMDNLQIVDFFYRLCLSKHDCKKNKNHIIIMSESKQIALFPKISISKLSENEFVEIIKQVKYSHVNKLVILCRDYDEKINLLKDNFEFEVLVLNANDVYYKVLKSYEFYPEIKIKNVSNKKASLKLLIADAFNKKKTKGYLLSSLCIFIASLFTPYKLYYSIVSSTLILMALFCQFNIRFNKTNIKGVFD